MKKINIRRTVKWHYRLTLKELQHIKETTVNMTLAAFKRNYESQKKYGYRCEECEAIAFKLNIE